MSPPQRGVPSKLLAGEVVLLPVASPASALAWLVGLCGPWSWPSPRLGLCAASGWSALGSFDFLPCAWAFVTTQLSRFCDSGIPFSAFLGSAGIEADLTLRLQIRPAQTKP